MESKRSNLFITDSSFSQKWNLTFVEPATENRYTRENSRFHSHSLKCLELWFVVSLIILYFSGQIGLQVCVLILVMLFIQSLMSNPLLKRFLYQVICLIWQSQFFDNGSQIECFGILLPSFLVNLLLLPSFYKSFCFFLIDCFFLETLIPDSWLSLLTASIFYTIILSCIEKDFRDIWHLYSSFKKSNSLNKALWDHFPGAELLVSNDGKIIYFNKCALKLMRKLRRPDELLKNGYFADLFPDFHDCANQLLQHAIRGDMHEELHVFKYQDSQNRVQQAGFLITAGLFSWVSGNCSRIMCLDVTGHISKKELILNCLRDLKSYLDYLNKQLIQQYNENQTATKEFITFFYRVYQQFKGIETIQSHFSGQIEVFSQNFDINGEILNSIEVLYLKASSHNITFTYTKEQAIPSAVKGDRSLHNVAVFNIIDFAIQNANEGSQIVLLLTVSSASTKELVISYKLTFISEKVTNSDIESIIEVRKNESSPKDIDNIHSINKKFGTGLACFDTILLALKGFLVPGIEQHEQKKVTVNFCIPFRPASKALATDSIQISQKVIRETPLTLTWKPDLGICQKKESGDYDMLKDQVAIVNSRAKLPKIVIQNCSGVEINPNEKSIYDNSISEVDICEENDASEKMKDYSICPGQIMKKNVISPVIRYRSSSRIEFSNQKNLIIVDESGETQNSLSKFEDIHENIIWAETNSKGLQICKALLEDKQKVSAFLFSLNKVTDKDMIKEIKTMENLYNTQVPLCGLSVVPSDVNYCKLLDVKNFSN